MRKKISISISVVAMLLIGIMATSVLASNLNLARTSITTKENVVTAKAETTETLEPIREISPTSIIPDEAEKLTELNEIVKLEEKVPRTYEETDAQLSPQRIRFLLYTHDGKYIMWGFVGNGYFVGRDNLGKRCWGIYGKNIFAGFYDGEFFWGRYWSGYWKAVGLFGQKYTHGKYILFPTPELSLSITANIPE